MRPPSPERAAGLRTALLLAAAASLASCSMFGFGKKGTPDNEPTLKTLAGRQVEVEKDRTIVVTEAQAIDAYRKFLDIAPRASQRSEAMRRIGDLEMDLADNKSANGSEAPDYKAAIARYNDFLKAYPNDPGNDRVLLSVARAYEQGGDLNTALDDPRPPGQGLSAQPLPRRGPVPPRRAAVHRPRAIRTRRRHFATVLARRPAVRTTTARSTCRAGRSSSRPGSRMALQLVLRRARPQDRRQPGRRGH